MDILFSHVSIVTMDERMSVWVDAFLGVTDGRISYLSRKVPEEKPQKIINGEGMVLMPGLINCHTHLPMSLLRGYGEELPLSEWLSRSIFPQEERMDARSVKAAALLSIAECLRFGAQVVIEQYIHGRELQVGILDGKALPVIEIIPKTGFYDYANKYQAGAAEEVCPAPIPAEWEEKLRSATETVFRVLELSVYSRADFIVTEDGTPYFLEINTLPGMTPTSLVPQEAAAAGIGYGELCERIVTSSLRARKEGRA